MTYLTFLVLCYFICKTAAVMMKEVDAHARTANSMWQEVTLNKRERVSKRFCLGLSVTVPWMHCSLSIPLCSVLRMASLSSGKSGKAIIVWQEA